MKLPNLVSISNEKLKFNFHIVVILPIACLLAFSGCSSIDHRGRTSFEEDGGTNQRRARHLKLSISGEIARSVFSNN